MSLEPYRRKRDFTKTPEPEPERARPAKSGKPVFTVQKHDARRLHYDLRLEHGGVLWSWAVTRGPSLVPGEKRLAVRTEDHPLGYATFEGTIPKDQYGGGTVLLWDRGTWQAHGDAEKGLEKGHLEISLRGERLGGRWHLVRMATRPRERRENWLLIKSEDSHARGPDDPDILEEHETSVLSGRDLAQIAAGATPRKSGRKRGEKARPDPSPGFVEPALAILRPAAPAGGKWLHEIKFDGYRIQAHLQDGKVRLLTRGNLDWSERFGKRIPRALAPLAGEAVLDGEIVVEDGSGSSDFGLLQADLSEGRSDRFLYYLFDLLHLDGHDLRPLPLVERKAELERLLEGAPEPLRYSAHFEEEGEVMLRHACRLSLEGLISKRRTDPYRSGRTASWIKSKCLNRQEFVILGYTPSTVSDSAIGGLLLGVRENDDFVPVGKVGTGFSRKVAEDLFRRLEPLGRKTAPTKVKLDAALKRNTRFVEPELVAEVEFVSWTRDGLIRHASFRALREDKQPEEIRREGGAAEGGPVDRPKAVEALTHPDRLYWPEAGITKAGLADYHLAVWRFMAPHLVNRPLALKRCPNGYEGQCFFQKHAWRGQSREILRKTDPLDESKDPTLIAIDSLAGLIGLVQGGALEIHSWQSSLDDLERPDQIVMDLDPDEGVAIEDVIAAAREVRDRLDAFGLPSFVKTTGGKGYHVVAPLKPSAGWDEVKGFAKGIAEAMAGDSPDRFVATISKAKRRSRILVDYLRNGRGATAIVPYGSRARQGAPVSMPIDWEDLGPEIRPDFYTVENAPAWLARRENDPWAGFRKAARPLPTAKRSRKKRTTG